MLNRDFINKNPVVHTAELLEYYDTENLNLIPLIRGDKKPVGEWKQYQKRRITKEEIDRFFLPDQKARNIGIVCGAISDNLFVIDIDDPAVFEQLYPDKERLVYSKTGRGYHVWLKAEYPVKITNILDGDGNAVITVKGEGGYVVAPPSVHESGAVYTWVQRGKIPIVPGDPRQCLIDHCKKLGLSQEKEETIDIEAIMDGVREGNRDNSLVYLIHYMRRAGTEKNEALDIIQKWNRKNKPPLEDAILKEKVDYHYGLAEPYKYFYITDPTHYSITDDLTLLKVIHEQARGDETITLRYKDQEFGTLTLKKVKKGVLVTIKDSKQYYAIDSLQRFDFYQRDKIVNGLLGHIKTKLGNEYPNFLSVLKPEIHARIAPKEVETNEEEEDTSIEYSEEIKEKAWALLKDPGFFYKIGVALEKGVYLEDIENIRYVVGENALKRDLVLKVADAMMGRKNINILHGGFATAKDSMLKTIFKITGAKVMKRGYITAAGMRYSKDLGNTDILYLPEADLSGEKGRQMRLMRADDGGFVFEYAYKNPETGMMETYSEKVEAKSIFITTNATSFDGAISSGAWLYPTDETQTLTKEVIKAKLADAIDGHETLTDDEVAVWQCAFDILTRGDNIPAKVKVPYAAGLVTFFNSTRSDARRSPDKLLDLIRTVAVLRRYQKLEEDQDVADLVDLFTAVRIGSSAIEETIEDLTAKEKEVYDIINESEGDTSPEADSSGVTAREISLKVLWSTDTCYRHAEKLAEKGYLAKGRAGRENKYSIKLNYNAKVGLSRILSLNDPKGVLEACAELVRPFFNSLISGGGVRDICIDTGTNSNTEATNSAANIGLLNGAPKYIYSNSNIIDSITGKDIYIHISEGTTENTEIKNDKIETPEDTKTKKDEGKNGIQGKPSLLEEEGTKKYKCVCSEVFATVEELIMHKANCDTFQDTQSKEARKRLEEERLLEGGEGDEVQALHSGTNATEEPVALAGRVHEN